MRKHPSPFGLWLHQARTSRGWSMQKLADLSGVHRLQIQFVESGQTQIPRHATRMRLYAALDERPPAHVEVAARRCSFCGGVAEARPLFRSHIKAQVGICTACVADANSQVAIDFRQRARSTVRSNPDRAS